MFLSMRNPPALVAPDLGKFRRTPAMVRKIYQRNVALPLAIEARLETTVVRTGRVANAIVAKHDSPKPP